VNQKPEKVDLLEMRYTVIVLVLFFLLYLIAKRVLEKIGDTMIKFSECKENNI
jgi:hypothetical protein